MAVLMKGTVLTVLVNEQEITVGKLRAVSEIKMDSDMVDVTTLDAPQGFRQYEMGLKSAGDVTLDGFLSHGDESQQALKDWYQQSGKGVFTITYPDGEKVQFEGLVKSLSLGGGEVDSVARFAACVRITGPVQFL